MMTPADLLPRVVEIVLEASAELLRAYRSGSGREVIRLKDGNKPVTRADVREAEFYAAALGCLLPEAFFVSAELQAGPPIPGAREARSSGRSAAESRGERSESAGWFVDPIDGTRGFVEGNGEWVTSVGLAIDGRPVLGVIAQPTLGRVWTAAAGGLARESYYDAGGGAKRSPAERRERDVESRVLDRAPDEGGGWLSSSRLVRSRTTSSPAVEAVREKCPLDHAIGSTALKMMMLARGDADLFVGHGSAWDTCAAEVILRAAGWSATVGNFDAEALDHGPTSRRHPRGVIASIDPRVHNQAWLEIAQHEARDALARRATEPA